MKRFIPLFFVFTLILCVFILLKKEVVNKIVKRPIPEPTQKSFDTSNNDFDKTTTIAFAGEMIFARTVASKINQYNDYKYPFLKIKPVLDQADLRFATLEAPLLGKNIPCGAGCMVFQADDQNIEGLKYANINIVSLAANHIMDAGDIGLTNTINLLEENNISHIGAGNNDEEARKPVIININDLKIGFLGYNNVPPIEYAATENSSGSALLNKDKLIADIKNLRPKVNILVESFHWGIEYNASPSAEQIELAHLAIDNGADLIIGDHPHWVQSIEFYRNKPIFYGLGNFVFDQMWSEETQKGIIAKVTFTNKEISKIGIEPFRIKDFSQPDPMVEPERQQFIDYVYSISDKNSALILKNYLLK